MKALTIRQPWVDAILAEGKDIENRSWKTNYRGWLAWHAAGAVDRYARFPRGYHLPDLDQWECSAICGVARLVDVVSTSRSKWFSGQHGGKHVDARPLRNPIFCKGALGLWTLTAAQEQAPASAWSLRSLELKRRGLEWGAQNHGRGGQIRRAMRWRDNGQTLSSGGLGRHPTSRAASCGSD
jgi:hypothetical protein